MDACNGSVRDGEFRPPVAGKEGASGEGHEVICPLSVAGGIKSNGAQRASMRRICWGRIVKNLGVAAEFDAHGGEIGTRLSGDDGGRAQGM